LPSFDGDGVTGGFKSMQDARKGLSKQEGLVLTSDEMARLSDKELSEKLPQLRVVARALPSDKSRLVKIAQGLNLVTGMTGDGVNDAPALKKADIGFAMGSGTEVAKEAGDVVILDDNIMSISRAVSYGRTIFKSIRKFIIFQMTSNLGAIAVSIIAPLLGVRAPITVIQILWMNLIMDALAGIAFAGERPRAKYMREKPKRRDEGIINRYMLNQMLVGSFAAAAICLWFLFSPFVGGLFEGRDNAYFMAAFFLLFMFLALFNTLNVRTHEVNLLSYLSGNKQFLFIIGGVMAIQVFLTYFGGSIFRTQPIHIGHFALAIGLALLIIPIDILRKLILKKLNKPVGT